MKLRNKKTGEIGEFTYFADKVYVLVNNELITNLNYTSLAELNEEWEDYEEPKECEYWYIEADGTIIQCHKPNFINHLLYKQKEIGNYFETKEEAESVLEVLKIWKRLKDKRTILKFHRYDRTITIERKDDELVEGDEYYQWLADVVTLIGGICEIDK